MLRIYRFFLYAVLALPCSAQTPTRPLTILHTNDLHAHLLPNASNHDLGGFAYLATALRQERAHCEACLYLNAGDMVQGTPVSTLYHGLPVYQISNLLGIDVGTLGNHEFDYGWRNIQQFLKVAKYPIVSANVVDAQGHLLTRTGYTIRTVEGMRIAVIGVVLSDLVGNFSTVEQVGPWHVMEVAEAVRKTVGEIGNKADLIVVLGHIHSTETDQILHSIPEVAVVIAGHEHAGYDDVKRVEGRVAVQGKSYGVELNRLDLQIDLAHHSVVSADWKHIPIDSHRLAPAPDVAKAIASWEGKVSKLVDVPIGQSEKAYTGEDLRTLVETAMAQQTGADIAWINKGNLRDTLPKGTLLARDIWDLLPFDNRIVIGKFKGSDLPDAIRTEHTIDPNREYAVAVTDFAAANQSSKDQLNTKGMLFPKIGPLQRDAMIAWIRKQKVIGETQKN